VARPALGPNGALLAALIWLANFGTIEKGRLIEIEALYVSLFGLALIFWLSWWQERRSGWLTWIVPWLFLGLGILAKGPLHLVFFYAVVVAVLFKEGELRKLLSLPHWMGLLIMTAVFAAWAVPYWRVMGNADVGQNWSAQLTGRLTGDDFKLGSWLMNVPRGLAYFLPWTLFLPLINRAKWMTPAARRLAGALGWGIALPFLVVSVLPGALPRYSMPALVPACWLMAMMLSSAEINWRGKLWAINARIRLVTSITVAVAFLLCVYAIAVVPVLKRRSKVKPIAAEIDRMVPDSETLYALDPDFQPFLFYVRSHLVYASRLEDIPANAQYVLIQPERETEVMQSPRWAPRRAQAVQRITDYRKRTVVLAKVGE
jgi:4-amino-4-deoxy-L-arabinose transferase-like glycosyltransferase